MLIEGPAAPDLVLNCRGELGLRQKLPKALLALPERPWADGRAVEMEEVEQEKDERIAVSDAFWIRLKEVMLSGRPHNSPSR
jgi:hypothetical protein